MKRIQMPSSYAVVTDGEKALLGGGGAATAICVQAALDGLKQIRVFNIKDQFYGFRIAV